MSYRLRRENVPNAVLTLFQACEEARMQSAKTVDTKIPVALINYYQRLYTTHEVSLENWR